MSQITLGSHDIRRAFLIHMNSDLSTESEVSLEYVSGWLDQAIEKASIESEINVGLQVKMKCTLQGFS